MADTEQRDWVVAAVDLLRKGGSWTGRVHIHKLLAIAKTLELADPPFDFELYHYGPYSYSLDSEIAEMEMYGLLKKDYPEPGWGPRYDLTERGRELTPGAAKKAGQLSSLAELIDKRKSQDLELIATWLWVQECEGVQDQRKIADRVSVLKPKYSIERIAERGNEAAEWRQRLKTASAPTRLS